MIELQFEYRDADGVVTERRVSSWRRDDALHLHGFDLDRREGRTFRLDRVLAWHAGHAEVLAAPIAANAPLIAPIVGRVPPGARAPRLLLVGALAAFAGVVIVWDVARNPPPAPAAPAQATIDQSAPDTSASAPAPAPDDDGSAPLPMLAASDTPPPIAPREATPNYRIRNSDSVYGCTDLAVLGPVHAAARQMAWVKDGPLDRVEGGRCWTGSLLPSEPVFVDVFVDVPWRASFDEKHWQSGVLRAGLVRKMMPPLGEFLIWVAQDDLIPLAPAAMPPVSPAASAEPAPSKPPAPSSPPGETAVPY